jgi:hypothetical protein
VERVPDFFLSAVEGIISSIEKEENPRILFWLYFKVRNIDLIERFKNNRNKRVELI